MKNEPPFEIEHRPVVKFGGVEYTSVEAAKAAAIVTRFPDIPIGIAEVLVANAEEVSALLLWQPEGGATVKPIISDEEIAAACKDTGVPYLIAKSRVRRQGWTLGKATTTPVRKRTPKVATMPAANQP